MRQLPQTVSLSAENNPGNARWCDEHRRLECTAQRRAGAGDCHQAAIKGINKCRHHSGQKREVAKAKGRATINAWNAQGEPEGGKQIDAGMVVLAMLQMSWLRVSAYGELLRQQVVNEAREADPEGLGPGDSVVGTGLIGYQFASAGKDGNIYAASEQIRALVTLESQERDRVVKYAETAHKMGISDRLTNLAEKWGDVVAGRISMILDGLELTPEQQSLVPTLIHAHLSNIDMNTTDVAA